MVPLVFGRTESLATQSRPPQMCAANDNDKNSGSNSGKSKKLVVASGFWAEIRENGEAHKRDDKTDDEHNDPDNAANTETGAQHFLAPLGQVVH